MPMEADIEQNELATDQHLNQERKTRGRRARAKTYAGTECTPDENIHPHKNLLRMEPNMFNDLLNRLDDRLETKDTWYRKTTPTQG